MVDFCAVDGWGPLALAVRRRRHDLDMSVADLARRSGVRVSRVRWLEAGHPVPLFVLARLDQALNWPPGSAERLLGGSALTDHRARVEDPRRMMP